ncbi:hypothetical protein ACFSKU_15530 [Pontibacter silvestris]|uniref:Transcriptional regulator n=1 Tax=Pontibacter silvestris TaxID=2305183 RepID=A0ABW4X1N8_9BACT|nr:hypothetical protein [Pontibacter silvestris]MCC9137537.1 hypothetical protein [Pontibacter silvestris]
MNYIAHLSGFFRRVARDPRFNPTHVSLYMALFQQWNLNHFRNPISIARSQVMGISRISSRVTYHKCIRELHAWGYIYYSPSFNHYRGSLVYMPAFDDREPDKQERANRTICCTGAEPGLDGDCSGAEQEVNPSINSTNLLNTLNSLNERARAYAREPVGEERGTSERKEKSCVQKEKKTMLEPPPELEEVRHFFQVLGYRELEAFRFFHHYSANGWMIGRHPMQDWQAAARKWVCNTISRGNPAPGPPKGSVTEGKDYAELL